MNQIEPRGGEDTTLQSQQDTYAVGPQARRMARRHQIGILFGCVLAGMAGMSICAIGMPSEDPDVAAALETLGKGTPENRAIAAYELSQLDAEKKLHEKRGVVIAALRACMADRDGTVRQGAAVALGNMIRSTETLQVLIEAIQEESPQDTNAAHVLALMGPMAEEAVPAVVGALRKKQRNMESYWVGVLEHIGTKEAMEAVNLVRRENRIKDDLFKWVYSLMSPFRALLIILLFILLLAASHLFSGAEKKILSWPLLLPLMIWVINAFEIRPSDPGMVLYLNEHHLLAIVTLLGTLLGVCPWLLSLIRFLRRRARTAS